MNVLINTQEIYVSRKVAQFVSKDKISKEMEWKKKIKKPFILDFRVI